MDLYICEKPSQAKDLAGVMKASEPPRESWRLNFLRKR